MDMSQFVAEEPQIPMRMQREVARLKRKVDSQAQKISEQDEKISKRDEKISEQEDEIRALRAKLRRYEEAESNNIRDEIFDENDNLM